MIALFGTALVCSLDSLIFAVGIGSLRDPGFKKLNFSLAFGIFDFAGSFAGLVQFPSPRFAHSLAASQLLFVAYLALLLLLMSPRVVGAKRVYIVPALLSLDNVMQPIAGVSITFSTALASGVMSGFLAFVGLWLGELVRRRLYAHASGLFEQNRHHSQVTQISSRLLTVRNTQ